MLPTALDELSQLWQIFCFHERSNLSSRNGDPTSTRMKKNKRNGVGIKNKKGVPYLQYPVKLAAAAVPLPKEPVLSPPPHQPSHPCFCDQVFLLKCKVWSPYNNKDTINELKRNNKDNIKVLGHTRLTSGRTASFPTLQHQDNNWRHNDRIERTDNHNEKIRQIFFDKTTIQNQVAKP